MAKAPKKTLYHSELVQLGPVEVEIKSDVLQSQYRGHNDYVILSLDGYDRNYECENDECVKALDKLKGQTVIIEAVGSRDEAEIIVSEATGGRGNDRRESRRDDRRDDRRDERRNDSRREERSERRQERREEAPPRDERRPDTTQRQTSQKPAQDPAKAEAWAIHHAKQECGRMINAALMCLHSADIVAEQRKAAGKELTADQYQALTSSFWIRMKDTGKINSLPSRLLHKDPPPTEKPASQRQTEPEQRGDERRQQSAEAPQPGPHEPPPDDDVPF